MKYIITILLITSFGAFAIEPSSNNSTVNINCFESNKKQHLSPARSKNFPQSRSSQNYYSCLDKSKKIVKVPKTSTPSSKVRTGAAVLLNPVGAAFWLLDKVVSTGVDKTVNK
jgi:hypothetical protein|tara:strand:- start:727 stop:1065 length:339 start_codon:yes stop_codon:yes gene_type:complete